MKDAEYDETADFLARRERGTAQAVSMLRAARSYIRQAGAIAKDIHLGDAGCRAIKELEVLS